LARRKPRTIAMTPMIKRGRYSPMGPKLSKVSFIALLLYSKTQYYKKEVPFPNRSVWFGVDKNPPPPMPADEGAVLLIP
jgi:hypothetical protein